MLSSMSRLSAFLFISLLLSSFVGHSNGQYKDAKLGVYWGQALSSSNVEESSLKETCATGLFGHVVISFLDFAKGGWAILNLTTHCNSLTADCTHLSSDITYCQQLGVTVLLSVRDVPSFWSTQTPLADTKAMAEYLFNNFLAGNSSSRPLGGAVLDGIELRSGGSYGFPGYLKSYSTKENPIVLAAAPECRYLGIRGYGLYDIVWPQFYSDECNLTTTWVEWAAKTEAAKIGLGILGAEEAGGGYGGSGYLTADELIANVLPLVQKSPKFAAVMVWNRYWDLVNGNFSAVIKPYVSGTDASSILPDVQYEIETLLAA